MINLSIQYINKVHKHFLPKLIFNFWIKSVLFVLNQQKMNGDINIRLVDEAEIKELNLAYRKKDSATNVLTFAYEYSQDYINADIVICCEVVEIEAKQQHKAIFAHYAHLIVHGLLHAFGYDHLNDEDNRKMQDLEIEILSYIGLLNPY